METTNKVLLPLQGDGGLLITNQLDLPIIGSGLIIPADNPTLTMIREKYGHTHTIEAVKGVKGKGVELSELSKNQSVCFGDGEYYYFLLTSLQ